MAKERPDEKFLKGSGVLELLGGIRMLEGQMGVALALLNECVGPLEVSAAVIEDEDGGEAIESLIERVKAFCAASYLNSTNGVLGMGEAQATPIRDALRSVQEMWDELHRRGLNPQLMRRYSDAITVLERDFTGRLPAGVMDVPKNG
jgi:hypothetical protein